MKSLHDTKNEVHGKSKGVDLSRDCIWEPKVDPMPQRRYDLGILGDRDKLRSIERRLHSLLRTVIDCCKRVQLVWGRIPILENKVHASSWVGTTQ